MSDPSSEHEAAIRLDAVSFGYEPGRDVVSAVSASLRPGRVTALIGPNAAGKTTAVRLMLGQLTPRAGRVLLGGRPIGAWNPRQRARRVGYVPQRGAVSFAFTVGQVVAMGRFAADRRGLTAGGEGEGDDRAVEAALRGCGLEDLRERVFAHLSGGQQQRVLLARAIAQVQGRGLAILLDEPASGMDLWHVHHTMAGLRDLAAGGLAVLVVVHDLNLAARYADDAWLMSGGELVARGPWDQVLTPQRLQPVYAVGMRVYHDPGARRPVLLVDPATQAAPQPAPEQASG